MPHSPLRICVCVNGPFEKTNGVRVRELFRDIKPPAEVRYLYRDDAQRAWSAVRFCREVLAMRPDVVFVEGVGYTGIVAGLAGRFLCGSRMILSTGDAAYAFAKACMSAVKARAVGLLEWLALRASTAIVVWGPYHKEWLEARGFQNVFWIPGGVDAGRFRPMDAAARREQLGCGGRLTIGVVGSINLNRRLGFCYGWEVVETVRLLKHLDVFGIVVGVGDGIPFLQRRARECGIADRIAFPGWIDHDALPEYVNAMDVCISTQSSDLVGQVRITAKVPEYLACGRFVIATAVGVQEFVKDCGVLLESDGPADSEYVRKIAQIVESLVADRSRLERGRLGVDVAMRHFDYSVLRPRLQQVLDVVMAGGTQPLAAREPRMGA